MDPMSDNLEPQTPEPLIEVAPTEPAVNELAGVPHGTILTTPEDAPDERVVHEFDESGQPVAWHKEQI